tara:strand:- start:45 stop:1550 length:1506 start_codon:yes stop_codon:yes gene_type:complete
MRVENIGPWNYQPVYPSQSACAVGEGTVYNVGPGKTYSSPKTVPWFNIKPCDVVNIHYSSTPYRDIIYFSMRGEKNRWIIVRGIPGPNGEKPIFDGDNAVMPNDSRVNPNVDAAGLFIVFKPSSDVARANDYKPGYLQIDGFTFQNARAPAMVTAASGERRQWGSFSSGLYVTGADFVAITNNEFKGNGLGLFANSNDAGNALQTVSLLVRGNYFHDNGNPASFSEHNSYTEGIGTIYEYNYFGPLVDGSYGDNIKERSSGVLFRYNYIEGGANLISLRDPESNGAYEAAQKDAWGERMVTAAFIYSNIFVIRKDTSNMIGHGDATHGTNAQYREGNIYFYGNRVIGRVNNSPFWFNNAYYEKSGIPLFALSNTRAPTTVVARNNLFDVRSYTSDSSSAAFSIFYYQGRADFESNWINSAFLRTYVDTKPADSMLAVGDLFDGVGVTSLTPSLGVNPGFVDEANGNFLTTASSPFASLNAALPTAVNKRCLMPAGNPVVKH